MVYRLPWKSDSSVPWGCAFCHWAYHIWSSGFMALHCFLLQFWCQFPLFWWNLLSQPLGKSKNHCASDSERRGQGPVKHWQLHQFAGPVFFGLHSVVWLKVIWIPYLHFKNWVFTWKPLAVFEWSEDREMVSWPTVVLSPIGKNWVAVTLRVAYDLLPAPQPTYSCMWSRFLWTFGFVASTKGRNLFDKKYLTFAW